MATETTKRATMSLAGLNRLRGSYKTKITKLDNSLKDYVEKEDSLIDLNQKLEVVYSLRNNLEELKLDYCALPDDANLGDAMSQLEESEEHIDNIEVRLKLLLSKLNEKKCISYENTNNDTKTYDIKLPEITLPHFDGDYENWSVFKSQFSALIISNKNLNECQKLHYLQSSLVGEAKLLQTPDDTFTSLFASLQERYENKRLIADTHINAIMNLEKMQFESAKDLRKFYDSLLKHVRALKLLDLEINKFSELMMINIAVRKLDRETRKQYEMSLKTTEFPDWKEFISFIQKRCQVLENIERNQKASFQRNKPEHKSNLKAKSLMIKSNPKSYCAICKEKYPIYRCKKFLEMTVSERADEVKKRYLCFNCLEPHKISECLSLKRCFDCKRKHHSLLHRPYVKTESPTVGQGPQRESDNQESAEESSRVNNCLAITNHKFIFLSTATIYAKDIRGTYHPLRALLDSASQSSFITTETADLLGIKKNTIYSPISGINGSHLTVKRKISTFISNRKKDFQQNIDLLIVPKITDLTPSKYFGISELNLPSDLMYADPNFNEPSKIDVLIGGELFYELLGPNQIKIKDIILQETKLGWVVTGTISENKARKTFTCCLIKSCDSIKNNLEKFWDLESIGIKDDLKSPEEDLALKTFNETITFKNDRYEVSLLWKDDSPELNDNYDLAERRFRSLAKRFRKNDELYQQYKGVIREHLEKGIIEPVTQSASNNKPLFYVPHQPVLRTESITTKLRVVFDASAHENGQLSLNDCLWPGPNLNPNLIDLLVNFRLSKVAFNSDIAQAFLQISLAEKDRDAVRFLWANNLPNEGNLEIQTYRLTRVLFGVNCSPFLLAATIKHHIRKYCDDNPKVFQILNNCFYVDDLIGGSDNVSEAFEVTNEAYSIMKAANMTLRKWVSNDPILMQKWEESEFDIHPNHLNISLGARALKVLGLSWDTKIDCFTVEVNNVLELLNKAQNTKRFLLKVAGKIFDPLGLLTPYTVRIKCLFQELWVKGVSWDEELPDDIKERWTQWFAEIQDLKNLKVPRYIPINSFSADSVIEIHGFSDASKMAYGAVIYVRLLQNDSVEMNLVTSKSRVAPLKKLTLPRLELLGALLLARLTNKIKHIVDQKRLSKVFLWTDSQITLHWIKGSSKRWKSFIANRVVEIQSLTDVYTWFHCNGKDNPADALTRGLSVDSLVSCTTWWKGPSFLHCDYTPSDTQPLDVNEEDCANELKNSYKIDTDSNSCFSSSNADNFVTRIYDISNNYLTIIYVLSFIFRFCYNIRNANNKRYGVLTCAELSDAENFLIRREQSAEFSGEIGRLKKGQPITGKLKFLNPFLDENNVLRVSGRLKNAEITNDKKYPIILPKNSKLTNLIMTHYHEKYLHVGPQSLLNCVRQKYWPINGRNISRKIVHNCLTCFKNKPTTVNQMMGILPQERVNPTYPFLYTGIDYCGPFHIKYKHQRKGQLNKIYVCIFVCLTTRAIHLDIVTDLTSEAFIATLKRFFSRRGKCAKLFSDNARNFIGANADIKRLHKLVKCPDETLSRHFINESIDWKFIPPRTPNFGGLWEAGVKSFKYHLKRVVGNQNLTFEEFLTVTIQIEGILNSRPLTPLSSDFDDFETLTPGHFLIGRPINTLIELDLCDIQANKLNRWQKTTQYTQYIWKRWTRDYLNNLQERSKWQFEKNNVKVGQLVLIKEDNLPINKWLTARIVETFVGKDSKIRVVNVKLPNGKIYKRSVRNLCLLPIE